MDSTVRTPYLYGKFQMSRRTDRDKQAGSTMTLRARSFRKLIMSLRGCHVCGDFVREALHGGQIRCMGMSVPHLYRPRS